MNSSHNSGKAYALTNVITGVWKFRKNISVEELIGLAKEWRDADTEGRYSDLHVRNLANGEHGIGFKYGFAEADHKPFFYRMSDQLKRHFGNDLVGWDIPPAPTWVIKQKEITQP